MAQQINLRHYYAEAHDGYIHVFDNWGAFKRFMDEDAIAGREEADEMEWDNPHPPRRMSSKEFLHICIDFPGIFVYMPDGESRPIEVDRGKVYDADTDDKICN